MNSERDASTGIAPAPFRWRRGRLGRAACLGLLALLLGGCGTGFPVLQRMRPVPAESGCRVAILPFTSDSDYPLAELVAYKVFSAQFAELSDAWVAQEGEVRSVYQQLRIQPGAAPSPEQLQILAGRLNAQLLITGNVAELRENRGTYNTLNPVVALRIDVVDGRSADTLWSTYNRRQGIDYQKALHFGQINSAAGLCRQASAEIITLWYDKGFPRCNVSSRF